jgi:hypothetical protein
MKQVELLWKRERILKTFCISVLYLCKQLGTYAGREADILYIRSFTYVDHMECVEAERWEVAYFLYIRAFTCVNHI